MNIIGGFIAMVAVIINMAFNRIFPHKASVLSEMASPSPSATVSVTPTTSPRATTSVGSQAGTYAGDFKYPGATVLSSDINHLSLETGDDFNQVVRWFEDKVNSLEGSVKISSSVNSTVTSENNTNISTNIVAKADSGNNTGGSVTTGNSRAEVNVTNNSQATGGESSTRLTWDNGIRKITITIQKTAAGKVTISANF